MKLLLIFILFLLIFSTTKLSTYSIQDAKEKDIHVSIKGCVTSPGEYELTAYSSLQDLLELVDLQENYDISMYNTSMRLKDGDCIEIPCQNETVRISINSGSINDLCLLPGIGEKIAQRIIDYRNENGFFLKLEDIQNVSGIGEAKYQMIKEYICL